MNIEIRYPRNGGTCLDTVHYVRQINDYVQIQTTWFDGCIPNEDCKPILEALDTQASKYRKQAADLLDRAFRLEAIAMALNQK